MTSSIIGPRAAAAFGGVASAAYIHKWPMRGEVGLLTEVALGAAAFAYKRMVEGGGIGSAVGFALSIVLVHFASLALATVLYRISPFHPLYDFPGPFVWKMTSLKLAQMVWSGKRHEKIIQLHKKYGKVVRTGT
ncbi:hypothetical protein CERSUDRAFT_101048 [Gelatoporia subvermispora B]|uniref:Uncharacterized protein n=1 Tax=Ceriporiopsis subvermispora (strain B) TaxID=914234 RepID=M2QFD1_CERS8|nr:hypothetical protein CERSUDRAFT_101046 [Gelatoporia subvermispora B]EMD30732.1 hypothetical protein CERSUDRAFT_101048 [Gelatoporia subvermispora B]